MAGTLLLACALGMPAHAQSQGKLDPIARYAGEILERSLAEIRRREEKPEEFHIEISDRLPRVHVDYLKSKGITDTRGVWFVRLTPKPIEPKQIPPGAIDVVTFGGDYVFFFRYPSTRQFEEWLGG
jgi:hypothetical protein